MTPDVLRKLAQTIKEYGAADLAAKLYAAADAWEADRTVLRNTAHELGVYRERIVRLRKRLEEAERTSRLLAGTLSTFSPYSGQHPEEILERFAALAKEKP